MAIPLNLERARAFLPVLLAWLCLNSCEQGCCWFEKRKICVCLGETLFWVKETGLFGTDVQGL